MKGITRSSKFTLDLFIVIRCIQVPGIIVTAHKITNTYKITNTITITKSLVQELFTQWWLDWE